MHFKLIWMMTLASATLAYGQIGYEEPWGKDADLKHILISIPQTPQNTSIVVQLAQQVILFHQNVLSPVDGPRSHFRPSSSQYMLLAMQKHGFIKGFTLGCDRLLRENHTPWVYQTIEEDGTLYKYDPVP